MIKVSQIGIQQQHEPHQNHGLISGSPIGYTTLIPMSDPQIGDDCNKNETCVLRIKL